MKNIIYRDRLICAALCIGIALTAFTGCKDNTDEKRSSEKNLTSFAFKKINNDWLDRDIIGTIDESSHSVRITVPEAAYKKPAGQNGNRTFKASFTLSPNAKLYIGTAEQKSDVTERLFIDDTEYKVIAENGSSKIYTLYIKIEYETPTVDSVDAEKVKKLYGTYRGTLNFESVPYSMWVVFDAEKSISYSKPMSAWYTNMQWKKVSETEWICRTYHKKDFKRETVSNTARFKIGTDGKITCKMTVAPMDNAESTDMEKGNDYTFSPDDGNGFSKPKKY